MLEFLQQPMPWYVAGLLIGLMVPLLLLLDNRQFGISSAYRHMCAAVLPKGKFSFFSYDWKAQRWNLVFVLGIVIGGYLASLTTPEGYATAISEQTKLALGEWGITNFSGLIPAEIFNLSFLATPAGVAIMVVGGFFIGFGARYGGGCTSGHAISGLSNLQLPSLIAVVGFFAGGLLMTYFILPLILN